ncbi:MAG: hypothetical protein JWP10_373, partial [Nocardioidaceae bacterium]|nr:hypothetical protein [Nocardioidaceae bacterium]
MRRLRLGVRLTPRGIGVAGGSVFTFIASLWTSSFELLYVCGGLAAMVASAAGYALLLPSKVSVRRDLANDVLHASATTRVVLTFETESVLPVGMLTWQDHLPAALKGTAHGVVDAVDQTDTSTASYEVRATRRGEHEVGPLDVSVGDPLGLVEVRRTVSGSSAVTILPTVVGLPVVRLGARSSGVSAWAPRQSVGAGEEDVIARPYVAGDAMRRIHWKATARHGELMTRQEEAIDDRRVAVVLDASAAAHGGEGDHDDLGDRPTFEWAVSAVASACARFVEHGDRVFLRVAGLKVVAR